MPNTGNRPQKAVSILQKIAMVALAVVFAAIVTGIVLLGAWLMGAIG